MSNPDRPLHPAAARMVRSILALAEDGRRPGFDELRQLGFTSSEIHIFLNDAQEAAARVKAARDAARKQVA